jgi:hypothetical protein
MIAMSRSVSRLKGAFQGQQAAVILGGTSLVDGQFDLRRLHAANVVTFLESRALTPQVVASHFVPDFFLMLSPEKCLSNALHNWVFRAMLAGVSIERLVRPEWLPVVRGMRDRADELFVSGNLQRGPHKRYRWRPSAQVKDSPVDLLTQLPATRILAEGTQLETYCPTLGGPHECYLYDQRQQPEPFSLNAYYGLIETDDRVSVGNYSFHNSAAIALYPLLHYLGFQKVYLIGMDMSMLGSMEYGAPYVFKSMLHFRWYFRRTRHVFNADYRPNRPWFLRPKGEFEALADLIDGSRMELIRVFAPYRYTVPTPFIPSINETTFWTQVEAA